MAYSYRPEDLVVLPVRDAIDALALSARIATAAAHFLKQLPGKAKLPPPLAEALADMAAARGALESIKPPVVAPAPGVKAADVVEDNAVAALADWLLAFMRLPEGNPSGDSARLLFAAIFGSGDLRFLNIKPIKEWAEVEARLKLIESQHLAPKIEALGGKPLFDHLLEAHRQYGIAVGATTVVVPEVPPQVRITLHALLKTMRIFVVRISASLDAKDPEAETRAAALMAPITDWTPAPVARAAKPGTAKSGTAGATGQSGTKKT